MKSIPGERTALNSTRTNYFVQLCATVLYYAVQQNCRWTTALMTDNPSNRSLVHDPFPSLAFGINLNTPQQNLYSISQCTTCSPCCFAAASKWDQPQCTSTVWREARFIIPCCPSWPEKSNLGTSTPTPSLSNTHACVHTHMVTPEATQLFIPSFSGRYYKSDSTVP